MTVTAAQHHDAAGLTSRGWWWWERRYSRQREDQLTAAHEKIVQQREHLGALLEALNGNTKVIAEFTAVQEEILDVMRARGTPATSGRG